MILSRRDPYEGFRLVSVLGASKVLQSRSGRLYSGHPLGFRSLGLDSSVRRTFMQLTEAVWFDMLVMLVIIANCVFLSIQGPPGSTHAAIAGKTAEEVELAFTIVFTAEMLCRVVAMGFVCGPHSYLRDAWNKLDFLVIVLAWLPYLLPQLSNLSAIRSVRALRPLRTINRLPGMKKQVSRA